LQSQKLSTVVEKLSDVTGLNFVYSSDKIDAYQLISLSVDNKPVDEVLSMIASRTNLTFKRQNKYVIIKVDTKRNISKADDSSVNPSTTTPEEITAARTEPVRSSKLLASRNAVALSEENLKNYLPDLSGYFGVNTRELPLRPLSMNNSRKTRLWFVSAGPLLNEYSAGVEFQIGIPNVYAVTNITLLNNGDMIQGYGLGTRLRLTDRFSLQPVYTFSHYRRFDNELHYAPDGRLVRTNYAADSKIHKMKLMIQYASVGRLTFSMGPSFNYLNSKLTYADVAANAAIYTSGYRKYSTIFTVPEGTSRVSKSWIGWEATIAYRISFPGQ
jgi:Secretin and TonB N terminus short domain